MTQTRLTDAKIAVLNTYGICDVDDIIDFDEATGLLTFANGEEKRLCQVWDRVMGYHRPTSAFNKGKKQEYSDRKRFKEPSVQL